MNIRCFDFPHTFLLVLIFVEVIYVKNKFTFTSLMFNKHWKCYYYISNNVKIYVTINFYSHKRDVSLWYLKSLAGGKVGVGRVAMQRMLRRPSWKCSGRNIKSSLAEEDRSWFCLWVSWVFDISCHIQHITVMYCEN